MSSSQIHSPNSVRGRGSDGDTRVSSACTPGGGGTSGDCSQDVKLRNDTNNAMQCNVHWNRYRPGDVIIIVVTNMTGY